VCRKMLGDLGTNKVVHVNGLRYGTKYHVLSFLHSLVHSYKLCLHFFESLMTFDLRHWKYLLVIANLSDVEY